MMLLRKTGTDKVGPYTLGLFDGSTTKLRPFVPVDQSINDTFRPLEPGEARTLRVGPLGEP